MPDVLPHKLMFDLVQTNSEITLQNESVLNDVRRRYLEVLAKLGAGDNLTISPAQQLKQWKRFVDELDSEEKVDIVVKGKMAFHPLIMGAYIRNVKYGSYSFGDYNPHRYLSRATRSFILSNYEYTENNGDWILEIARESEDIDDLMAIAQNFVGVDSYLLRNNLAKRSGIPNSIQIILAIDSSHEVRNTLANNPSINEKSSKELMQSGDEDIRLSLLITSQFITIHEMLSYWENLKDNPYYIRKLLEFAECPSDKLAYIVNFVLIGLKEYATGSKIPISVVIDIADKTGAHPGLSSSKRGAIFKAKKGLSRKVNYGNDYGIIYPTKKEYDGVNKPGELDNDIPF